MATHERLVRCEACGRKLRASNLERHLRGVHMLKAQPRPYGKKYRQPLIPITVGKEQDRRYDAIAQRGPGSPEQHRIYRLRAGELQLLATAPDPASVGVAIFTLWSEGEFEVDDSVGWLNTESEPGHWVASPWSLGRRKETA